MVTLEELEKTHSIVQVKEITATNFKKGRDPKYAIDGKLDTRFSMPKAGDKCNVIFSLAQTITHIALAFRQSDKRKYKFKIGLNEYTSNIMKDGSFEVFQISFTGTNMEIIGQGYTNGKKGGWFSIYELRCYQPKGGEEVKKFKTDFVARVEISGIAREEIKIESAESLEFDPNPELAIDGDLNTSFKNDGRGRVLRLKFKDVYRVTDIELTSNLVGKQQLVRIESNDFATIEKGTPIKYPFQIYPTGNHLDIILNGNTADTLNDIAEVKLFGFTLQQEEDALKKRLQAQNETQNKLVSDAEKDV